MSLSKEHRTGLQKEIKRIDTVIKTLEKHRQWLLEQTGERPQANSQTSLDKFKDEIRRQYLRQ
jgi:hypothetical protein